MSGLQVICGFHLTGSIFLRAYSLPGIGGGGTTGGAKKDKFLSLKLLNLENRHSIRIMRDTEGRAKDCHMFRKCCLT